ncbi:cyclin-J18 [Helianthus annuus]|uniref:cyclin-J18 n=1 Tax=Helianthus annuus TaxID=4232 RepID=UPI000B900921|nr:cyclin-J18 [Helianthus annuus]
MTIELCSDVRIRVLDFFIQSAQQLQVPPIVKYTAFSFFAERFCPIICRSLQGITRHWLLQPVTESNLQLFALIAIWISSKIHDSRPLTVKKLKILADKIIHEQHYTTRDFAEAEVIFMQVLNFEIGTSDIVFRFLEDLLIQLKEVATIGDHMNLEVCMDIMDLLYEKEETTTLYTSSHSLAASILVASYVIMVPKQRWEFPVIPWVKYGMACTDEEIIQVVTYILKHVLQPSSC